MGISAAPTTKPVTKLGRPLIGKTPLFNAERQRRWRERHEAKTIT
jgi:hypothetical protein